MEFNCPSRGSSLGRCSNSERINSRKLSPSDEAPRIGQGKTLVRYRVVSGWRALSSCGIRFVNSAHKANFEGGYISRLKHRQKYLLTHLFGVIHA